MADGTSVVPSAADVRAGVVLWLRLPASDTSGDAGKTLDMVVASAVSFVAGLPIAQRTDTAAADSIALGTIMLAARLVRRRNSPGGIEAMTESGAAYVARTDSDVSRLLGLDQFQAPMIG
ncbi:putative head-tail connector [Curtobacterium phage Penoan]|nr:putative head-tail connector [Curtobacterium phage Penoan]